MECRRDGASRAPGLRDGVAGRDRFSRPAMLQNREDAMSEPIAATAAAGADAVAGPSPWAETLAQYVGRLNLSSPVSLAGEHFPQIVALTCLVTGGFLILFGWRHHRYVLAVIGMLVGGWLGLAIKGRIVPEGILPALPYLGLCGAVGAFLVVFLRRLVGILLGGFTAACAAVVFFPDTVRPGDETLLTLSLAFLLGGGFGALFPRFFFIFNTCLAGASFCTYALSVLLSLAGATPAREGTASVLLHLGLFLPMLVVGIGYQYATAPAVDGMELAPPRRSRPKVAVRPREDVEAAPVRG
jgi:hypothetical protein